MTETEAWNEVAAQSNRDLDAYLRTVDPTLPEHYGMPVDGVRRVVESLRTALAEAKTQADLSRIMAAEEMKLRLAAESRPPRRGRTG